MFRGAKGSPRLLTTGLRHLKASEAKGNETLRASFEEGLRVTQRRRAELLRQQGALQQQRL